MTSNCCSQFQLEQGDTIGVLSVASPTDPDKLTRGLQTLLSHGYSYHMPLDPSRLYGCLENGFGSDTPIKRAEALHALFLDPQIKVIILTRGGYGTLEILPLLDFDIIAKHPKPIIGFSDCTPLLLSLREKSGTPSIHGPALAVEFADFDLNDEAKHSVETLLKLLRGEVSELSYPGKILRSSRSTQAIGPESRHSGAIFGGNLTMLTTTLGTPWEHHWDGGILFVEEIGEAPYRVHRLFTQLKLAGKLDNLAGLCLGEFTNCLTAKHSAPAVGNCENKPQITNPTAPQISQAPPTIDQALSWIITDILSDTDYPILSGLPIGHARRNAPIPLGYQAQICDSSLFISLDNAHVTTVSE